MSHQQKKRRLDYGHIADECLATFDALSTDELVLIFEYLSPENIMLARLNKKMRDAATKTVVPIYTGFDNEFRLDSVRKYNALVVMTTSLPNLQQIKIVSLGVDRHNNPTHKFNDGEDPNNSIAISTANLASYDIGILSNFTRLRELKFYGAPLNGRYPMLFNFPLLQKLHIFDTRGFKLNLEMLVGLPSLKELMCGLDIAIGEIKSLRVLKDTLSKVDIGGRSVGVRGNVMDLADFPKLKFLSLLCCNITGDLEEKSGGAFPALETLKIVNYNFKGKFMNLSDLPHLKVLDLWRTEVTGDIRDISNDDFPSLESLILPPGVYGGSGFQLQRITDAPDVVASVSSLQKQRPDLQFKDWYAQLSHNSPEWYEGVDYDLDRLPQPPFKIEFVKAGRRWGWRWTEGDEFDLLNPCCEINWVDPEPSKESVDYEAYIQELEEIADTFDAYKGFHQPPTEEEYHRIIFSQY